MYLFRVLSQGWSQISAAKGREAFSRWAAAAATHFQHRIAVWTTSATPHLVKIPSAAGQFDVVTNTGEQEKPLVVNGDAIEVMVSDSPQYLMTDEANPVLDKAPGVAK